MWLYLCADSLKAVPDQELQYKVRETFKSQRKEAQCEHVWMGQTAVQYWLSL